MVDIDAGAETIGDQMASVCTEMISIVKTRNTCIGNLRRPYTQLGEMTELPA